MKNSLQVLLTNSYVSIFRAGIFVKNYYFEKSGIKRDNLKMKIDFSYKVLKSIVNGDKEIHITVLLDYSFIDYTEQAEIQLRGKETNFECIAGSSESVISIEHKYFWNKKQIRDKNLINSGDEYYELMLIHRWKQELMQYLYYPLSELVENFSIKPSHEIFTISGCKNETNLVVEFSSKHTDVSIYKENDLIKATRIHSGIDTLVALIAEKFAIPFDSAKILFQSYGMVVTPTKYTNFVIDIPLNEFVVIEVPVPEISNQIQIFFTKLFNEVSSEIQKFDADISLVTLTGEANKLQGLDKFTSLRFRCNVKSYSKFKCLNDFSKVIVSESVSKCSSDLEAINEDKLVVDNENQKPISFKLKQFVLNFLSDTEPETDKIMA